MRPSAVEIIRIARPQYSALVFDGDLQPANEDNSALFPIMGEQYTACIGPWFVAFFQDLKRSTEQALADLPERNPALADLDQFTGLIEDLLRPIRLH